MDPSNVSVSYAVRLIISVLTPYLQYVLLFPGENLVEEGAGKETVWALYARVMMLWNACVQMRASRGVDDATKAAFAIQAWIESVTIEDALDLHACSTERALIFFGREYLFK